MTRPTRGGEKKKREIVYMCVKSGGLTDGGRRKRRRVRPEQRVGVQKTEQIRLVRRRSAKARPLAGSMTVRRGDARVHGWPILVARGCGSECALDVRCRDFRARTR